MGLIVDHNAQFLWKTQIRFIVDRYNIQELIPKENGTCDSQKLSGETAVAGRLMPDATIAPDRQETELITVPEPCEQRMTRSANLVQENT